MPHRVEHVPLERLRPHPLNPRRIGRERFEALCRSLEADPEMLLVRPIVALPDGRILGGNMRYRAALRLGWDTIPCVTVDLDETRAKLWILRDNNAYGDWHAEQLPEFLYGLHEEGADLELTGFDPEELGRLLASVAPGGIEEAPPDPTEGDLDVRICEACGQEIKPKKRRGRAA